MHRRRDAHVVASSSRDSTDCRHPRPLRPICMHDEPFRHASSSRAGKPPPRYRSPPPSSHRSPPPSSRSPPPATLTGKPPPARSSSPPPAPPPSSYYAGISTTARNDALKAQLQALIYPAKRNLTYDNVWLAFRDLGKTLPGYPCNPQNASWIPDIYSDKCWAEDKQCGISRAEGDCYSRCGSRGGAVGPVPN